MKHIRRRRAFTMIEVAVVLAIAGIIALASTVLFSSMTQGFIQAERQSTLSDSALQVSQFLSSEIASIGGNGTTSNNAIFVDDNCAAWGDYPSCAANSDRVRVFSAISGAPSCRIFDVVDDGNGLIVTLWQRNRSGQFQCCLNDEMNDRRPSNGTAQYLRRHALVTSNEFHKPVLLTAIQGGGGMPIPGVIAARIVVPSNPGPFPNSNCAFRLTDVVAPTERSEPPNAAEWRDGTIALADYRTLFINADNDLILHVDRDENDHGLRPTLTNGGTEIGVCQCGWHDPAAPLSPDAEETVVVAHGVYDMQVVLGYDANDTDATEVEVWRPSSLLPPANSVLRMVRIDYLVGTTTRQQANLALTPLNPTATRTVANVLLRSGSVRVAPRNLDSKGAR